MNKRVQTFDLLKGIAVLLMIQVHIIELFASQQIFESPIGSLLLFLGGPPVAPVFLVVFGFFIAKGNKDNAFLFKRATWILFIGLLLNILLNLNLIIKVLIGSIALDVKPYIFGVDILFNAAISLFIIIILRLLFKDKIILYVIIIILSAFLGNFLLNYTIENIVLKYVLSLFFGASKWSYFPVFPWLAYSLTGYALYLITKDIHVAKYESNNNVKILLFVFFVLFLFFTIRYAIAISSDVQSNLLYYHHGLIFFLWVFVFLFFYTLFVNEAEKFLGNSNVFKFIKYLGKHVTLIYFVQWILIGNIATEIYKTISSYYVLVLFYISIVLISTLVVFLILKIRRRRKKSG